MIVPGLPTGASGAGYTYSFNRNNVDVFADFGSPAGVVSISFSVAPGVVIGSTSAGNPAMDASGFASGSTLTLINHGRIQGMGGAGGRGQDGSILGLSTIERGGGGGGGAGTNPGAGGAATSPATAGTAGTTEAGGAGGVNSVDVSSLNTTGSIGGDGGAALATGSLAITIDNANGEIWGGGGGGSGGMEDNSGLPNTDPAKAGGGPGASGPSHSYWGTASPGNAVDGTASTFSPASGGTSPQLEGPVG